MSRVGRKPVEVISGVKFQKDGRQVKVAGPKGELTATLHPEISVDFKENRLTGRNTVRCTDFGEPCCRTW